MIFLGLAAIDLIVGPRELLGLVIVVFVAYR